MNNEGKEIRKSLAVDPATYDLLNEICQTEHRSKIDQLKVLIQKEHRRLAAVEMSKPGFKEDKWRRTSE